MLRISRQLQPGGSVCLKLEGKLDGAGASILETECEAVIADGRAIALDLVCLRFADGAGVETLRRLRAGGVRLFEPTPLVERLLRPTVKPS